MEIIDIARGHQRQEIFADVQLGSTGTIVGIYRVLRSLQAMSHWADTTYRQWWNELLGCLPMEDTYSIHTGGVLAFYTHLMILSGLWSTHCEPLTEQTMFRSRPAASRGRQIPMYMLSA